MLKRNAVAHVEEILEESLRVLHVEKNLRTSDIFAFAEEAKEEETP